ncbi:MAG: hypothetical protein JGK37_24475 [Microcoleus sp. PH2017_06_SFM_O_A]|nr:hypothetical protein [Microcoleus sp. PH2017_06_SFM_O_A]
MVFWTFTIAAKTWTPPGWLLLVARIGSKLVRSTSAGRERAALTKDWAASGAIPLSIKSATKLVRSVTTVESGGAVTGVSRGNPVAVSGRISRRGC